MNKKKVGKSELAEKNTEKNEIEREKGIEKVVSAGS